MQETFSDHYPRSEDELLVDEIDKGISSRMWNVEVEMKSAPKYLE
jgi:hypothetical protein